ncbi:8487_t:CDS:2, partial [Acaulospora morrowiae]
MDFYCVIQVRLEGRGVRNVPVGVGYSQGTSVQAVLERACKKLGIYDSWNYALYSQLFKTWLCETHLLSSYPEEDTLIIRKKTPAYIEIVYNEENPRKRRTSSNTLSPNTAAQTKRRGVFSSTKTCLKTRFQTETIYLTTILFASDGKVLITSGSRMFPTIEVIRNSKIFGNFEDDSDEFAQVIRTSLDWTTSVDNEKDDTSSDTDSLHSNSSTGDSTDSTPAFSQNYYFCDHDTLWSRSFAQAAIKLKNELSLESLGTMYEHVVPMNSTKAKFIVSIQHVPNSTREEIAPDLLKAGILKWKNFDEINNIYQKDFHPIWVKYIENWCSRQIKLSPGLYLGVLYTESTLQGIKILVPKDRKHFIPLDKIRDEATITPEEASWIKSLTCLSQDCFMDLASSTRTDENKSNLGQFQASFVESYHKLQRDTNLTWEVSDIYNEQTVDIYLDLQTNQLYTMMGELDDNITTEQCGTSHLDLCLDPNTKIGPRSSSKRSSKLSQQVDLRFEENVENRTKGSTTKSDQQYEDIEQNESIDYKEDVVFVVSADNREKDVDGDIVNEEATLASSNTSFNNINYIKPFVRIVFVVKPMRQPHQIRDPYYSTLCMLYPFPLYDSLQNAAFNTSLYACSRRAMQILQASRTYFTHELVQHLQKIDNFAEINEHNVDDFFFDPDELLKVPDDARKIHQALEIIKEEIVNLRQQWNAASWTMTAMEWDRQRTIQAYSFGGRPMGLNISSRNLSLNRAASAQNVHLSNNSNEENDENSDLRSLRTNKNDAASRIEILRGLMFHAPDRAWNHIRFLGIPLPTFSNNKFEVFNEDYNNRQKKNNKLSSKTSRNASYKPPPPILMSYLSSMPTLIPMVPEKKRSSVSSALSSHSSNSSQSTTVPPLLPARKKSAGHRLMRTLGFGSRGHQQNIDQPELPRKFSDKLKNPKESQVREKDGFEETTIINVPLVSSPLLTPSFLRSEEKIVDEPEAIRSVDNITEDADDLFSADVIEHRQESDAQIHVESQSEHRSFEIKVTADEPIEVITDDSKDVADEPIEVAADNLIVDVYETTIVATEDISVINNGTVSQDTANVDSVEVTSEIDSESNF